MVKMCQNKLDSEKAHKILSVENVTDLNLSEHSLAYIHENVENSEPILDDDELNLLKMVYVI